MDEIFASIGSKLITAAGFRLLFVDAVPVVFFVPDELFVVPFFPFVFPLLLEFLALVLVEFCGTLAPVPIFVF